MEETLPPDMAAKKCVSVRCAMSSGVPYFFVCPMANRIPERKVRGSDG